MNGLGDFLLIVVVILGLQVVAASRITAGVRAVALQGAALAFLPFALGHVHGVWGMVTSCAVVLALKGVVIPLLLRRAIEKAHVAHESEPFVSLHVSVLLGAALVGAAFWISSRLVLPGPTPNRLVVLPGPTPNRLVVPIALATLLLGFLVIVTRRKAVTQVVGYLMLENGVFIFGQALAAHLSWAVELAILLDVLAGVFVMGIAIHHISREFDHMDVDALSELRD